MKKIEEIIGNKKSIYVIVTIITIIVLIGITSYSYSAFFKEKTIEKSKLYETGNLSLSFIEENNSINIKKAIPVKDEVGSKLTPYTFKIKNNGSISTIYEIQLVDGEEIEGKTRIERRNIRIQINEEEPYTLSEVEDKVIYKSGIGRNEEQEYNIRIWIDYNATKEISGQYFTGKIVLKGSTKTGEKAEGEEVRTETDYSGSVPNYKIYGNSIQDTETYGEPTPENPVNVVSVGENSKNLFDENKEFGSEWTKTGVHQYTITKGASSIYDNKLEYMKGKFKEETSYTLTYDYIINESIPDLKGFRFIFVYTDGTILSKNPTTETHFTITSDANKTISHISTTYSLGFNSKYINIKDFQVEENTTATEYRPYKYIDIVCSGKNILKLPTGTATSIGLTVISDGQNISMNGTVTSSYAYVKISGDKLAIENKLIDISNYSNEPVIVKAGETITISRYATNTNVRYIYATYIDGTVTNISKQNPSDIVTYTTSKDITALWFQWQNTTILNTTFKIQVEKNSDSTNYEPYQEPITTTIDLTGYEPLRKIGDVADYIDYNKGKIIRKITRLQLSTDLNKFTFSKSWDNDNYTTIYFYPTDKLKISKLLMNNYFKIIESYSSTINENGIVANSSNGYIYTKILKSIATSNLELNTWLLGLENPIYYYYELATPIEENIELPPLKVFNGTTIFNADSIIKPNIQVKY